MRTTTADAGAAACRRVDLIDAATGAPIRGAEDIVVDPEADIAYVSAFDRWAAEDAAGDSSRPPPEGGIYALPLAALRPGDADRVTVEDLSRPSRPGHGLWPHGIDLYAGPDGRRVLYAVNRRYTPAGSAGPSRRRWRERPVVEVFDLAAGGAALRHRRTVEHPLIRRPNDVAAAGAGAFFVTNDHGACGGLGVWTENVLGLRRANVVSVALGDEGAAEDGAARVVASGIGFANGIALGSGPDGPHLYVAATRQRAVLVYRLDDPPRPNAPPSAPIRTLPLAGGGPDNITPGPAPPGRLLAAVHPSLFRLALYRYRRFGVDRAPSRIVELDPRDGSTRTLLDDPSGATFSAATVAAAAPGGLLLAGSFLDRGILVCRGYGPAATA